MYDIRVDRPLRLVRVRIVGLQDSDEVAAYERDLKQHILNLTGDGKEFNLLVDLRESKVVSQQNTTQLRDRMQWYIEHGLRKSALIFTSMLMQLQTRRLAPDDRFNYFLSEEDAIAWLWNEEDPQHP